MTDLRNSPPPQYGSKDKAIIRFNPNDNNWFFVAIPQHRKDWQNFIKSLPQYQWLPEICLWQIPRNNDIAKRFSTFFGNSLVIDKTHTVNISTSPLLSEPYPPKFAIQKHKITIHTHPANLKAILLHLPISFLKSHLEIIKNIHGRRWHKDYLMWELPYTQITIRFIQKYLADSTEWTFDIQENIPERLEYTSNNQAKKNIQEPIKAHYENAIIAFEQVLILKRYSWRTIKLYKQLLRGLFLAYNETKPSRISRQQIDNHVYRRIKEENISESYQNSLLSAIKFFIPMWSIKKIKWTIYSDPKHPKNSLKYSRSKRSYDF